LTAAKLLWKNSIRDRIFVDPVLCRALAMQSLERGFHPMRVYWVVQNLSALAVAISAVFLSVAPVRAQRFSEIDADCKQAEQAAAPHAVISNGLVKAVVYLPDANNGIYRAARFDWSGAIACLDYKGHSYFDMWNNKNDPTAHDSISGPVEDFRSADGKSAPFYDDAKPGELFVKPGIGLVRRIDDKPYRFQTLYPLVDGGKWTIHTTANSVSNRQELKSQFGVAYVYTKTLELDRNQPILEIQHSLKNTGTKTIDIQVYDHDFYRLDNEPTGPAIRVRFPFEPKVAQPFKNGARIDGKQIVYDRVLQTGESAQGGITGFSDSASDYDFILEDSHTGAGVEQTADVPLASITFWSVPATACPEAYIHVTIPPGQTGHWTIKYRFFTK
jgi:hypothetical protein